MPYLGLMRLKIKKGLLPWRYRHHTNTPYHVQRAKTKSCTTCKNKPTNRLQRPRKPNNSQMRQLINPSTHKLINQKNHKLTNPSTHKLINSKKHQLINSSTQKLKLLFFILQQRSIFRAILAKIWGKK